LAFDWFTKLFTSGKAIKSPTDYFNATVTPADIVRRWSTPIKALELYKRALACSTVQTNVDSNGSMLSQFVPRMYMKAGGKSSVKGVKNRLIRNTKRNDFLRKGEEVGHKAAYYADRSGEVAEVIEHPFLSLYRSPNFLEAGAIFWRVDFALRQIYGNSFSEVILGADGLPAALFHVYPQYCQIIPSKETLIEGYRYLKPGNAEQILAPDECLHLKWAGGRNGMIEGTGWVETVIPEIDLLIQSSAVEQARFDNGCRMDFMVLMPDANPFQAKQMREAIDAQHKGVARAGGYMIATGATNVVPIARTNKEMEFIAGCERWEKKIRQAAGVTEAQADLNQANLASASMADTQYLRATIQPNLITHAEQMTKFLCDFYGEEDMWIAYENVVPVDKKALEEVATARWLNNSWKLNEFRAEVNLDPVEGPEGDMFLAQLTGSFNPLTLPAAPAQDVPIDTTVTDKAPAQAPAQAPALDTGAATVADTALNGAQLQGVKETLMDAAGGLLPLATAAALLKLALPTTPPEQITALVATLDGFTPPKPEPVPAAPGEVGASAQAQATPPDPTPPEPPKGKGGPRLPSLSDEGHKARAHKCADGCRCGTITTKSAGWDYPFSQGTAEQMRAAAEQWLTGAVASQTFDAAKLKDLLGGVAVQAYAEGKDGGVETLRDIPGGAQAVAAFADGFNVKPTEALDFLKSYTIRAKNIAEGKQQDLKDAIAAAMENGENSAQATERVWQALKDRTPDECENIALTESSRAYSQGGLKSWTDAGVKQKRFLLAPDACPVCKAVAAKFKNPIPLGQNFFNLGDKLETDAGTKTFGFEDVSAPPIHCRCRCSVLPVL
jgi:hypothetical protein